MGSAFEEHFHKPDCNICIVCLLQLGAISVPAPLSVSSFGQAVDHQREAEATVEPVEFTGIRSEWARWVPPVREDSELEGTATPSWMFQSADDFQQLVEDADLLQIVEDDDLLQNVEDADLPQVVRGIPASRTTEPVTSSELYSKWIPPKPEGSGINETVIPKGSTSPALGPKRGVDVAAEPIILLEVHPSLSPAIVMQDDWTQLDSIAISNAFSASFPLLAPKRMGKVTGGPTEPDPGSIPPAQNGIVTPNVFSRSSSCRTVDSKQVSEAAAEPITFTEPHPKSIPDDWQVDETATSASPFSASFPALQDDCKLDPIATPNGFSASSPLLDPKRVVKAIAGPVVPTKPHLGMIPATQSGIATPNIFSKSPSYSIIDELIKPHPNMILAMQEKSQFDEIPTHKAFYNYFLPGKVDSKQLEETRTILVTLTEPHPRLTSATYTQDETEITNALSFPRGASGPERVVEFIAQPRPVDLTKPNPKLILAVWEDLAARGLITCVSRRVSACPEVLLISAFVRRSTPTIQHARRRSTAPLITMSSNPSDIWSPQQGTTTFTDTFSPSRRSYTGVMISKTFSFCLIDFYLL